MSDYLEIETKYSADDIEKEKFISLINSFNTKEFIHVESKDIYYTKGEHKFLRYRMAPENSDDKRSELTFKKKHIKANNIVRTEVNVRIDQNKPELIEAFCEGLGYKKNFSIFKKCEIFHMEDAVLVYYEVFDENNKNSKFLEIEVLEDLEVTEQQAWEIIQKYEKMLSPLGINPQKRMKLSLFERYKK